MEVDKKDDDDHHFLALPLAFLRLQLKTLCRCKAVCKSWKSIIASGSFAADYRNFRGRSVSPEYGGYFFYHTHDLGWNSRRGPLKFFGNGVVSAEKLYSTLDKDLTVICSSNGILLCYAWVLATVSHERRFKSQKMEMLRYYVCNPLTGDRQALPFPPDNHETLVGFHCREGDPSKQDASGLTYAYEVVRLFSHDWNGYKKTEVQVYSSKSGRWSNKCYSLFLSYSSRIYLSVVVRGVFYWLDYGGDLAVYYPAESRLEMGLKVPKLPVETDMIGEHVDYCSIAGTEDGELLFYSANTSQIKVFTIISAAGSDETPFVWKELLQVKFADLVDFPVMFQSRPFVNQMPGSDPWKVLFGLNERLVYSLELRTGKWEMLPYGQGSCLGRMYNEFYCPYHKPSWYFKL